MPNVLSKHNDLKLKLWQKGAIVGLGIALITLVLILPAASSPEWPGSAVILLFVELPVFPIFLLVVNILETFLPFLKSNVFLFTLLAHFISWVLGLVLYAYIFKGSLYIVRKFTKSQTK